VNFKLAATGEEIGLFAADGTQVDAVTFGQQTNDVSAGRCPDGSTTFVLMPGSASPRAANYLPAANSAPVLNPIGDKIIFLGQTLVFTATASDTDTPSQILQFTLDPSPPPGATISSAGAFVWMPSAVGSFPITLRVTDSGVPPLTAAERITVDVLPVPAFARAVRNGDELALTWAARAGQPYAVDYKDRLDAPTWTPLWTNLAWGDSLSFTNSITHSPQRFFRLRAGWSAPP